MGSCPLPQDSTRFLWEAALCRDGLRSSPKICVSHSIAGAALQPISTGRRPGKAASHRDRVAPGV